MKRQPKFRWPARTYDSPLSLEVRLAYWKVIEEQMTLNAWLRPAGLPEMPSKSRDRLEPIASSAPECQAVTLPGG